MPCTSSKDMRATGIALLRIVVGAVFIAHGWQKIHDIGVSNLATGFGNMGIPMPMVSAILATTAELGGGLLLVLGLATRFAAAAIAFTMLVAWIKVHHGRFFLPAGAEYVMVLLAASLLFIISGPGCLALDNLLFRRRNASNEAPSE